MSYMIAPLSGLIEQLSKLPGIGGKTAQRLALHIITAPEGQADALAASIVTASHEIRQCEVCGNITDQQTCTICTDMTRNRASICVVRDARDIMAMERARVFKGLYHVLGGCLSPIDGIGPDELNIKSLMGRLDGVEEVVIATNPDVEGEATAVYLSRLLKPLGLKVSRIAHGVPVGGDLEYTDDMTLQKALEGRREM